MKPYFAKHCSPNCGEQCEANGVATDANHGEAIREDSQSFCAVYRISFVVTTCI